MTIKIDNEVRYRAILVHPAREMYPWYWAI